jgi:formylglycine-generating enzyme required for sulfatase activity/outer membrane protein assembly factor BamB
LGITGMKRLAFLSLAFGVLANGCGKQGSAEHDPSSAVGASRLAAPVQAGRRAGPTTLSNSLGMKLALIPAGEFLMGSPDTDPAASADEKPQHRVRISRPFYLGVTEVTQAQYQKVMGSNPSFFAPTGPGKDRVVGLNTAQFPVEQVRWHDAQAFCRRLTALPAEKRAGRTYRLPTEAEWEYACRAGTTTPFHFGAALSSRLANFNGNFPSRGASPGPFLARTAEVGSYRPNAFGLYDMHGNVWEWCSDWFDKDYYRHSPRDDPAGPSSGSVRVIRGGEWYGDARDCRSAFRYADLPEGRFYVLGFRVVMTPGRAGGATAAREPAPTPRAPPSAEPGAVARVPTPAGEDWPRWRGPRGDGTWQGPRLPTRWPDAGLRRLWRQPVGGGHSGVVVGSNRAYTLDYHKEPREIERVLCFDAGTGRSLWSFPYPVRYGGLSYGNGPRATPTIQGGHVYTLGALGQLHCLDAATGRLVWARHLVRQFGARVPVWGFAASPVVFENLLIVAAGARPNGCLLGLNRRTGREVWRSLPDEAGYATPLLTTCHGRALLVCWTASNVCGLDPSTGRVLWTVPFEVTYGSALADPICQEGIVLVSSYYAGAKAIRLGPDAGAAEVVWEDRRNLRALMAAPLYRAGHVYLLDKRHGLTCCELRTGRKLWDDGNRMTPKGRNPQATLVWAGTGAQALILNSQGELILARLSRGYHEQSRTRILGPTWAHPAYAGGRVYARSDSELVCVALR